MNEHDYPALYRAADETSKSEQAKFFRAFSGSLICLSLSALLSAFKFTSSEFAAVESTILFFSLALIVYLASANTQQVWYGSRALAESIKTITWRYMMRAEPYNNDDAQARYDFSMNLRRLLDANNKFSERLVPTTQAEQITAQMENIRSLSLEDRRVYYEKSRIADQLSWYTKKANSNRRNARAWFSAIITICLAAVLISIIKIVNPVMPYAPVEFFFTSASGLLAWTQTKRFQELSASYALTAHEIGLLKAEIPRNADENRFSLFVSDSENAFSREHTQWQARRDRGPGG